MEAPSGIQEVLQTPQTLFEKAEEQFPIVFNEYNPITTGTIAEVEVTWQGKSYLLNYQIINTRNRKRPIEARLSWRTPDPEEAQTVETTGMNLQLAPGELAAQAFYCEQFDDRVEINTDRKSVV